MLSCDYNDTPDDVIDAVNDELEKAGVKVRFKNVSGDNSWFTFQLVLSDGSPAIPGDVIESGDENDD